MMSIEMERWRVYFENSGEDLWTVIDWALTIAAVNYPQELRIRRDGYAEKLFAPSHYPLVSSNCEAPTLTESEVRNVKQEDHRHDDEDECQRNAATAAARACSYGGAEDEEEQMMHEITGIGKKLEELDEASQEEDFVRPLQRLKEIKAFHESKFAVQALKVTGIGKVVNKLRKHPSKRVKAAANKLVRLWKHVVDELVKTEGEAAAAEIAGSNPNPDEGQNEEGELIEERCTKIPAQNRVDLLSSSVSSVTQPSSSQQSMQMLDTGDDDIFGCSPDDARMEPQRSQRTGFPVNTPNRLYNTKLNGYRKDSGPFTQPTGTPRAENESRPEIYVDYNKLEARTSTSGPVPRVTKVPATAPNTTARKPLVSRPAKPHSPECPSMSEKLEAAKRRLHEGYQQASNVKKQRTVQVMGLEEVPPEGGHGRQSNIKAAFGNGSRRGGQR